LFIGNALYNCFQENRGEGLDGRRERGESKGVLEFWSFGVME